VSFPSAATILDRTGTKPAYIENLEVTRIAKPTKVDREIFDIKKHRARIRFLTQKKIINPRKTIKKREKAK
jgi:hypothetical protein